MPFIKAFRRPVRDHQTMGGINDTQKDNRTAPMNRGHPMPIFSFLSLHTCGLFMTSAAYEMHGNDRLAFDYYFSLLS